MSDVTMDRWRSASAEERRALADSVGAGRDDLRLVRVDDVAVFIHRPSGLPFHLVPGGTLQMGIGDEELERLRAQYQYLDSANEADYSLREGTFSPVVEVTLAPFLLAAHPIGPTPERSYESLALNAEAWLDYLQRFEAHGLTLDDVLAEEEELAKVGLRLPSEAEWEWAARAGTKRSFPHGDTIPDNPNTGVNPLGFVDLGAMAEVCADAWSPTLEGTPRDGTPRRGEGARAVRGGAATCYPWQDCGEWVLLLCGARSPSGDMDGMLAVRPALGLR